MERRSDIYVPPTGPGEIPELSGEIYESMGEEGIFSMLEDFYAELGSSDIRSLFGEDLLVASRRSATFYVQLLGGPPLYIQQYGPPMMRRRHFPFEIDEAKRQVWVACFNRVLDNAVENYGFPPTHLESFRTWIDGFSKWMVNVAPG